MKKSLFLFVTGAYQMELIINKWKMDKFEALFHLKRLFPTWKTIPYVKSVALVPQRWNVAQFTLLKVDQCINHLTHKLGFVDISIFCQKLAIFVISRIEIKSPFKYIFLFLLTFIHFLQVVLISLIAISMMSANPCTPDLLKTRAFLK